MPRDGVLAAMWLLVLAAGIAGCVVARRLGLPAHDVRDALHVGTGVWVLGWPLWEGAAAPAAIVLAAAAGVLALPLLDRRAPALGAFRRSVTADDERWAGIVLYALAYAALTIVALRAGRAFAAGAALLALSLGDGIGGRVGRLYGRVKFAVPGGKKKTLEGSVAVAALAAAGVFVAAAALGASPGVARVAGAGALAALVEALSPRATDNVLLPGAVFLFLVATES